MSELRVQFHHQMEDIDTKVIRLFALVSEDLAVATQNLLSGDQDLSRTLTERERTIDALYLEIEDLVNLQFATQAPVARDLRFLLTVLRIVPELERSHDLVIHIARRGGYGIGENITPRARGLVERLGTLTRTMWEKAGDGWHQRDPAVGTTLDDLDDEVDELHSLLTGELATGKMDLSVAMDMTLVARFYERLGDHAVNVARRLPYLAGVPREGIV